MGDWPLLIIIAGLILAFRQRSARGWGKNRLNAGSDRSISLRGGILAAVLKSTQDPTHESELRPPRGGEQRANLLARQ